MGDWTKCLGIDGEILHISATVFKIVNAVVRPGKKKKSIDEGQREGRADEVSHLRILMLDYQNFDKGFLLKMTFILPK